MILFISIKLILSIVYLDRMIVGLVSYLLVAGFVEGVFADRFQRWRLFAGGCLFLLLFGST